MHTRWEWVMASSWIKRPLAQQHARLQRGCGRSRHAPRALVGGISIKLGAPTLITGVSGSATASAVLAWGGDRRCSSSSTVAASLH